MAVIGKPKRVVETDQELLDLVRGLDGITIHHKLSVKGDETERLAWDPNDLDQIREARDRFYDNLDKGYMAFAIDPDTGERRDRKIIEFQPDAGEMIFTFRDAVEATRRNRKIVSQPPVVGG